LWFVALLPRVLLDLHLAEEERSRDLRPERIRSAEELGGAVGRKLKAET